MIRLDDPAASPPLEVLDSRGGFLWWYLEILDAQGSGLVLIWSYGLPFLPGYTAASRRGEPQRPADRPSLNLAVYERGQPVFYVLHEFDPGDVSWDGHHQWRFGDTRIWLEDHAGGRVATVDLDVPVRSHGARARGRIRAAGRVPTPGIDAAALAAGSTRDHRWTPLALPCFGTSHIELGGAERRFDACGRAYLDRNWSHLGLHDLGIDVWTWGHVPTSEGERVFYVLWPEGGGEPSVIGCDVGRDGAMTSQLLTARFGPRRRTLFGMNTWPSVDLSTADGAPWARFELADRVDHGPFYLRYLPRVVVPGEQPRRGSLEVIDPSRVDLDRHRPLVKMRVATDRAANSMWLPLFQGHRGDRLRSLARAFTGARRNGDGA